MGGVRTKRQPQSEHHSPDHGHGRQLTAVAHPTREAPELSIVGHTAGMVTELQTDCKRTVYNSPSQDHHQAARPKAEGDVLLEVC